MRANSNTELNRICSELRLAIECATQGEWRFDDNFVPHIQWVNPGGCVEMIASLHGLNDKNNMRFIALANPHNLRAILDELSVAQERIVELEGGLSWFGD